jgi:hypothetical protein
MGVAYGKRADRVLFCRRDRVGPNCTLLGSGGQADGDWHLLRGANATRAKPPQVACDGGSFVSLITRNSLALAALCLRRQLESWRSRCPHILVYEKASLSEHVISRLRAGFGARNMVELEALIARAASVAAAARQAGRLRQSLGGRAGRLTRVEPATRLPRFSDESLKKLWLWALPPERYKRVCYLDVDVLLRANVDALLAPSLLLGSPSQAGRSSPVEAPSPVEPPHLSRAYELAAVPAVGCSVNVFNGGILVLRPSLAALRALLVRERTYERVGLACEPGFTDQSLLNAQYRGGCSQYAQQDGGVCAAAHWRRLPLSYNLHVAVASAAPATFWAQRPIGLVHFAGGRSKPWDALAAWRSTHHLPPERAAALRREGQLRQQWRQACGCAARKRDVQWRVCNETAAVVVPESERRSEGSAQPYVQQAS